MRYASLYIFHFIHFIATGCAAFLSKYYGEIGLSDGRIGLLTSAATILAMGAMPLLGCAAFWRPMSRLILEGKEETEKGMEPC